MLVWGGGGELDQNLNQNNIAASDPVLLFIVYIKLISILASWKLKKIH